jgi:hypothetical protein
MSSQLGEWRGDVQGDTLLDESQIGGEEKGFDSDESDECHCGGENSEEEDREEGRDESIAYSPTRGPLVGDGALEDLMIGNSEAVYAAAASQIKSDADMAKEMQKDELSRASRLTLARNESDKDDESRALAQKLQQEDTWET